MRGFGLFSKAWGSNQLEKIADLTSFSKRNVNQLHSKIQKDGTHPLELIKKQPQQQTAISMVRTGENVAEIHAKSS